MPLQPGKSRETFLRNLAELSGPGATPRPLKQRLAIAYAEQRKSKAGKAKKKGGGK